MGRKKEHARSKLLVIRCRKGDDEAFSELVEIWERPLLFYIRRLVKHEEDAWDILQEVWILTLRKISGLRKVEALPAWLYSIARNAALMNLRKNNGVEMFPRVENAEAPPASEAETDFIFTDADAIHWGLEQLPIHQREVLVLYFLEDFSIQEIGTIINTPLGTVKSRLHYAKKALRNVLQKEGYSNE